MEGGGGSYDDGGADVVVGLVVDVVVGLVVVVVGVVLTFVVVAVGAGVGVGVGVGVPDVYVCMKDTTCEYVGSDEEGTA